MSVKLPDRRATLSPNQHEPTSVDGRVVGLCALSLFAMIVIAMLASRQVRDWLTPARTLPQGMAASGSRAVSKAGLDPNQQKTRSLYEAEQQERLSTYGWLDRGRGKVHIPIERAIAISIQKNRSGR